MSLNTRYLTEEELLDLIAEVESNDYVTAPPYMREEILNRLIPKEQRIIEFRRYCRRVATSATAAILIICLLPLAMENTHIELKDSQFRIQFRMPEKQILKEIQQNNFISDGIESLDLFD